MDYTKLADAFFRALRKNHSTNVAVAGYQVQFGWDFITMTASNGGMSTVTFPEAFTNVPLILCSFVGKKATSDPTSASDVTSTHAAATSVNGYQATTTGFSPEIRTAINFTAGDRAIFTWLAIG